MRVIAGTARSLPLKTVDGPDIRPTTDRIKETLFNMLQTEIPGCRFLDLFAGSGAIGIEALSRGAREAVFVEQSRAAAACIRENLAFTKLEKNAVVLEQDALSAVRQLSGSGLFDLVFMDAPYHQELEHSVLSQLKTSGLIDPKTTLVIEEALNADFSYIETLGYKLVKTKNYKTNKHLFLRLQEP